MHPHPLTRRENPLQVPIDAAQRGDGPLLARLRCLLGRNEPRADADERPRVGYSG
jgi:hypothetical protein